MARKKKSRSTKKKEGDVLEELESVEERGSVKGDILSIVFFAIGLFFILSSLDLAGDAGAFIFENVLKGLFGAGFFVVPLLLITLGIINLRATSVTLSLRHWIASGVFLIAVLGLFDLIIGDGRGGLIGRIGSPLEGLFDVYASVLILLAVLVISALVLFEKRLKLPSLPFGKKHIEDPEYEELDLDEDFEDLDDEEDEPEEDDKGGDLDDEDEAPAKKGLSILGMGKKKSEPKEDMEMNHHPGLDFEEYTPPPVSLLGKVKGKPSVGDIKANATMIKRTLQNFGIDVEMDEVSIGPTVTRYALKPAEGVRLSRIVGLQKDLELALAAHPVRIEAPIPGKSLVGIEVPNRSKAMVGLGGVLGDDEFTYAAKPLTVALGKSVSGVSYFASITKMPHMLIAGATGAGKSVTVHAIVTSLLYRHGPQDLRFIMVDPKRVELTLYNSIPHLLTPVIKEPKKAIIALKWAAKEMERRYDILENHSVRDLASYHQNVVEPAYNNRADDDAEDLPERLPYIVVIIDELADIMQSYPRELESAIVRLAQMSRAVGIHLILSTQRPSVNVITGLIKANIPTRIALQVSSQVDSRTILDTAGAEKLLGAGDMLYAGSEMSKPIRLQSPFISESEVKKVVDFIHKHSDDLPDEISLSDSESVTQGSTVFDVGLDDEEEDELFDDAKETVLKAGKASTSYLQRKLKVGYSRAARLMDMLEERGIIGPANGSKPREVLAEAKEGNVGEQDEDIDTQEHED